MDLFMRMVGTQQKHACAVYSNQPLKGDFQRRNVQEEINAHPKHEVAIDPIGKSIIESIQFCMIVKERTKRL